VCAATLVGGPDARASHETAAALWAIPGFTASSATPIVLTVPRGRRPQLPGIRIHQSLIMSARHVASVDDVRATSVARTLCDLDGRVSPHRLGRLVDEMLTRQVVSIADLRAVHGVLRRGRRWSRGMAEALGRRGEEAERADTVWEAEIVRWLREAGLPEPVQQYEISGYSVDLAYPEERVLIEFDGFGAHSTRTAFDGDRRRQNALLLASGAVLLRFTSASTRDEVVGAVAAARRRSA
jgi:very-short-patch-repair endonuclease